MTDGMSRARKAAFAAVAALLALLLLEGGLRVAEWALGADWTVSPLPEHEEYQVICPYGDLLRLCPDQGPSYELVRPEVFFPKPDRPRAIAIGESFVYGLGLPKEQAWPAHLAARLENRVEVLNFGRCGTYASRLVPIVEAAAGLGPDVVILSVGNNEHTMTSFFTGWAGRHPLLFYRVVEVAGRIRLFGLLSRVLGAGGAVRETFTEPVLQLDDPVDQLVYAARRRPPDLGAFKGKVAGPRVTALLEEEQRLKERIFRNRLREMVDILQDAGVQVVLTTLPRDLTTPPVLSGVHEGPEERIRELVMALESGGGPDRARIIEEGLALDDKVAHFHYAKGMDLLARGRLEEAARELRLAVEWDLIPDATPSINAIIREVARERGVELVDLDRLADAWLTHPRDFFLDPVHVGPGGAEAIAEALAPVVARLVGLPR